MNTLDVTTDDITGDVNEARISRERERERGQRCEDENENEAKVIFEAENETNTMRKRTRTRPVNQSSYLYVRHSIAVGTS